MLRAEMNPRGSSLGLPAVEQNALKGRAATARLAIGPLVLMGWLAWSGPVMAQAPTPSRGYVEGVAQSAFGEVTSQSFGGEAGVTVLPNLQIFVEGGRVRDTTPTSLSTNAQTIASYPTTQTSGVTFGVKQPATFGVAGVRYLFPVMGPLEPYIRWAGPPR